MSAESSFDVFNEDNLTVPDHLHITMLRSVGKLLSQGDVKYKVDIDTDALVAMTDALGISGTQDVPLNIFIGAYPSGPKNSGNAWITHDDQGNVTGRNIRIPILNVEEAPTEIYVPETGDPETRWQKFKRIKEKYKLKSLAFRAGVFMVGKALDTKLVSDWLDKKEETLEDVSYKKEDFSEFELLRSVHDVNTVGDGTVDDKRRRFAAEQVIDATAMNQTIDNEHAQDEYLSAALVTGGAVFTEFVVSNLEMRVVAPLVALGAVRWIFAGRQAHRQRTSSYYNEQAFQSEQGSHTYKPSDWALALRAHKSDRIARLVRNETESTNSKLSDLSHISA